MAIPCDLAVLEVTLELVDIERPCEQESLCEVASLTLQLEDLAVVFDTLGQRLQAECLAQLDERVGERVRLARARQVGDEGAVDLQRVNGELAQVGQRAVSRPEVVDRYPDAELLELR